MDEKRKIKITLSVAVFSMILVLIFNKDINEYLKTPFYSLLGHPIRLYGFVFVAEMCLGTSIFMNLAFLAFDEAPGYILKISDLCFIAFLITIAMYGMLGFISIFLGTNPMSNSFANFVIGFAATLIAANLIKKLFKKIIKMNKVRQNSEINGGTANPNINTKSNNLNNRKKSKKNTSL